MGRFPAFLISFIALTIGATPALRGTETTSKFFGLHVDARGETEAGYVLNLKLYKEKELLLETDTKLSKRSPLVIKGPQVGGGQLLLVLVVQ